MKVIEPGHIYEVENVDGDETQRVEFVRRRDADGELLPENFRREGILCQDLIRVLIDRTLYLYAEAPCEEDTEIIESLRHALARFETRASRRSIEKLSRIEVADLCPKCQHILCRCGV